MWITILLAVLLCLSIGYSIYQKRKTYRLIDRLLDSVLNREMIAASDVEEGEYSALVSKIKQIQEVLDNHVNSAEQEFCPASCAFADNRNAGGMCRKRKRAGEKSGI